MTDRILDGLDSSGLASQGGLLAGQSLKGATQEGELHAKNGE
jgi:hypothetical protein